MRIVLSWHTIFRQRGLLYGTFYTHYTPFLRCPLSDGDRIYLLWIRECMFTSMNTCENFVCTVKKSKINVRARARVVFVCMCMTEREGEAALLFKLRIMATLLCFLCLTSETVSGRRAHSYHWIPRGGSTATRYRSYNAPLYGAFTLWLTRYLGASPYTSLENTSPSTKNAKTKQRFLVFSLFYNYFFFRIL